MFERPHLQSIIERIKEPRKFMQVIMGPRQVGKTTLVTQLVEKLKLLTHFISADAVAHPIQAGWHSNGRRSV